MNQFEHPYREFLLQVERPIRYLGGEYGSAPPGDAGTRVVLAFPDTYEIGMCFLGFHILYDVLRNEPGVQVERVFSPWPDLEAELRKRQLPLVSLESGRALAEFDVVGFSLQYELTFTNVLAMLDLGGIPLLSTERRDEHPIVLAGGPVAFQAEAVAPFIDAFVLGDGEEILPEIVRTVGRLREAGTARPDILAALARLPGLYVPALVPVEEDPDTGLLVAAGGVRIERVPPVDLAKHPFPTRLPVPDTEVVFDRYAIEIARGCNGGCRFCQGGFVYRPLRLRQPQTIVETARRGLRTCGFDGLSLTSLSTADYPGIDRLVPYLAAELEPQSVHLSVSSLRAYDIPDELLAALGSVRPATLTFALEAGTQRLRDLINKNVREEDIHRTVDRLLSRGWRRIKLYFMIGLPTETDDDVEAIMTVTRQVHDAARRFGRRAASGVTASVSTFVPKPHTPFQWEPMLGEEEIRRRQRLLYTVARRHRISLKWHEAAMSIVEGVMARGDRRVAGAVRRAYELGCRFDGWADRLDFDRWQAAFRETGVDPARYLGSFPRTARLPWSHLDVGVDPAFMQRERDRADQGAATEPCSPAGTCHACGAACDPEELERFSPELPAPLPVRRKPREPAPYRVVFRRYGRLSYISQLDLVRTFPRLFRRAGVALAYSQGLRPRPLISFSPALPLGATALRDLADARLNEFELDGTQLARRLQEVAPAGLDILGARPLGSWEKKLSRRVAAADSLVALEGRVAIAAAEDRLGRFLDADRVEVAVRTKTGVDKPVDLRSWVFEARVHETAEGLDPSLGPFLFLRTKPESRILFVVEHVTGATVPESSLYRADLLARGPLGFTPIT
jgi:radical SAM family uncharacterized protein/radical SAM-linked protein